jgi:hypothetical protein
VTDRIERGRFAAENSRLRAALAREGRLLFVGGVVILLLAGGIGTFLLSRNLASGDLVAAREQIEQLRTESQGLRRQLTDQAAELTATNAKLADVKGQLEAINPSKNVYILSPNETRIVADGHLTIGLVGSPGNESISLDINGKQQTALAGQPIAVAPDPSSNCMVTVQSFDMFKAAIVASCAAAKPK